MNFFITILFLSNSFFSFAQQAEEKKIIASVKQFHEALVKKDSTALSKQTDKALSYGHSNGWVENKNDLITDLQTGIISYQKITEDSITVIMDETLANVRFVSDVDATMRGNKLSIHLKVLEVWKRKNKHWVLFARQAVK